MLKPTVATLLIAALLPVAAPAQAPSAPRVPLRNGLTIVTALNQPDQGDY